MKYSDDLVERTKKVFKEEHGKEMDNDEAEEALSNLAGLFDIFWKWEIEDQKKKNRLKKEPGGFPVDGHYSCLVCGCVIDEKNGWYDWYGQTCLLCRKAITDGAIPAFVCTDRDSYFPMWKLSSSFDIKHQTARKLIREGKLKARIVPDENGKPHAYIFLKKENPGFREYHTPEWKSHQRYRQKLSEKSAREFKEKIRAEKEALRKKSA